MIIFQENIPHGIIFLIFLTTTYNLDLVFLFFKGLRKVKSIVIPATNRINRYAILLSRGEKKAIPIAMIGQLEKLNFYN